MEGDEQESRKRTRYGRERICVGSTFVVSFGYCLGRAKGRINELEAIGKQKLELKEQSF